MSHKDRIIARLTMADRQMRAAIVLGDLPAAKAALADYQEAKNELTVAQPPISADEPRNPDFPEPGEEGWVGQIFSNGKWMDYARGFEVETRAWQLGDPAHRRIKHWITGKVIVPATGKYGEGDGPWV